MYASAPTALAQANNLVLAPGIAGCETANSNGQFATESDMNMIKTEIPSRRNVLRGSLAAACSLWVPATLLGCNSKPSEPATNAAPAEPAAPSPAATPGKVTQASVKYQAQPKGDLKCGDCMHFSAESSTCKLVDGPISLDGWCSLWSKKA